VQNVKIQNIQVHPANGLTETIRQMNQLEMLSLQNKKFIQFVYQNFYTQCAPCIPGKIWNYIKANFDYVPDDPFDEIITAPYILLQTKKGDCDDFALFAKTCLDILGGWYTNYLLLGENFNQYTHIVCFAHRGRFLMRYNDPVIIDGANDSFNYIPDKYKFNKVI
jgi:hypothetical protein